MARESRVAPRELSMRRLLFALEEDPASDLTFASPVAGN